MKCDIMLAAVPDNGQSLYNLSSQDDFNCLIIEASNAGVIGRFFELSYYGIYDLGKFTRSKRVKVK